jgi:hypothetical protein
MAGHRADIENAPLGVTFRLPESLQLTLHFKPIISLSAIKHRLWNSFFRWRNSRAGFCVDLVSGGGVTNPQTLGLAVLGGIASQSWNAGEGMLRLSAHSVKFQFSTRRKRDFSFWPFIPEIAYLRSFSMTAISAAP